MMQLSCPAATKRLLEIGVPATVEHATTDTSTMGGSAKYIAETVQLFITLMDSLKLNLVAKDQIHPQLGDLIQSINKVSGLPPDYEGKAKIRDCGAFSEVRVGTERAAGKRFAVKIIDKALCKGKEGMIDTEVKILQKVKHENIIQLYEMYEMDNKIYLIMELVTGGELFDEIVSRGKYSEVDAAKIVYKILLAIEYLHEIGIAHRDLKPENLLLSERGKNAKLMISDFGLSKIFSDEEVMKTACGTPGYVAPEVLQRKGYGKAVDLWSIGVITYILLCGYPPFYHKDNVELFKQIMAGKYEFDRPWWENISDQAKDFIRHLLVVSPKNRYDARQALDHPFIKMNTVNESSSGSQPAAKDISKGVQHNLSKGISGLSKGSFKVSEGDLGKMSIGAVLGMEGPDDAPGRPLGDTSADSGVVRSNDSVSSTSSKKSKAKSADTSGRSINEQANRTFQYPSTPYKLRFLTYNIFLRPPGIRNNASDHKSARLSKFGESFLPTYDILCLQEVFAYGTNRQTKMINYGRKAGLEYWVCSPSKGLLSGMADGGLLIMSKYPIIKTERMTYKKGVHNDRFSAKGVIYARVAVTPTSNVHIFNTHLQSTYEPKATPSDASVQNRLAQVAALKEFIDACVKDKPTSEPIFVAGSLNVNARRAPESGADSDEYQTLMKILKGDPAVYLQHQGSITPTAVVAPGVTATTAPRPTPMFVKDLCKEAYGEHPVTFGDVTDHQSKTPKETTLTAVESLRSCTCVDYILMLNTVDGGETTAPSDKTTKVERFGVEGEPFNQLSDHYGIATEIRVN
ncbi:calcium calmodulin-dependent protein kinase type 1G [Rhizophlyctis rosea]|nr:calcium calmodulin-dependent protein kinase type 1G [Rhizophlyctis rosea]